MGRCEREWARRAQFWARRAHLRGSCAQAGEEGAHVVLGWERRTAVDHIEIQPPTRGELDVYDVTPELACTAVVLRLPRGGTHVAALDRLEPGHGAEEHSLVGDAHRVRRNRGVSNDSVSMTVAVTLAGGGLSPYRCAS